MSTKKLVDQLLLLAAGLAMIAGLYWVTSLMKQYGASDSMVFFVVFNLIVGFILTWQGVALFRDTPGFWLFHGCWAVGHILVYGVWGHWGSRLGFCALTLPLEAYCYYIAARARLLHRLGSGNRPSGTNGRHF